LAASLVSVRRLEGRGTGRSRFTAMTHIAIQEAPNGSPVDWMERVSDEQYRK
jgi:hypothetical protein